MQPSPAANSGIGRIETEAALEAFVQQVVDRLLGVRLSRIANLAGIRFGVVTLTWPGGAANSNASVVPHGLGAVPTAIDALPLLGAGGITQNFTAPLVTARTKNDFTLQTRPVDSSVQPNTATQPVMWVAFV